MQRWTTWPGLWLGLGTWLYATPAVLERRGLGHDPTAPPDPDAVALAAYVPELVVGGFFESREGYLVSGHDEMRRSLL